MLSPAEACRNRTLADCDSRYTKFLVDCALYAVTGKWQVAADSNEMLGQDSEWPWQIDVWPSSLEIENSRRIVDSNTMRRSRHLGGSIEPMCRGVDKYTAEARRGFWNARKTGYGVDSGFGHHIGAMFDDFDLLGIGSVGVGLETDRRSGKQKATLRHFKATDVLWERNVSNPADSKRVTRRQFVTFEEALWRWGKTLSYEAISSASTQTRDSIEGRPVRIVPVYEYWDVGLPSVLEGKGGTGGRAVMCEPTRCVWIGSLTNGPVVVHEANPLGCLPQAPMVNKLPPEVRYPFGAVMLEMASNELATQMTKYLIGTLKKGPVDLWRKNFLDPDQLLRYRNQMGSDIDVTDQATEDMKQFLMREQGVSVTNGLPMLADLIENRYNRAAGLSEADQGQFIEADKTLGEFTQTQGEAQSNRAFGKQQVEVGLIRTFERFFEVAKRFDRAPVQIDVFGDDYFVNAPGDPRNSAGQLLQKPCQYVVDSGALTASDAAAASMARLRKLQALVPYAAAGDISSKKLAEETLKAIDESMDDWEPTPEEQAMKMAAQQVVAA